MKAFIHRHRLSSAIVAILLLVLATGLFYLNWLFEEASVQNVNSITHHVEASSVLAVFAHPDDEQLVTGLLIRASSDRSIRTAAVTATKGEAGTPLPQISRLKDLGAVRKAEALKNTWALGIEHHDVLDFPDGGLTNVSLEKLTAVLIGYLTQHRPDLVVTFWPASGFSDHADHKRMGLAAETAIRQLQRNPVSGYEGPRHIAYVLAPTRMMKRFGGEMGQHVVSNQPLANLSQDGEAWAKLRGWEIHASQRDYVWHAYGLPAWLVHGLNDKEFYYLLDTKDIPVR